MRARRSRDDLAWALVALMHDRAYDDITVQDICERANVGRSTFYAHFQDKDEMFVRHVVLFGEWMGRQFGWNGAANRYQFGFEFLANHVRDMRPVFDSLAKCGKIDLIVKVWRNNFAAGFERTIVSVRGDEPQPVPAALVAQHIAGAAMTLLIWWVDHHYPMEARELDAHFHRLIANVR